ncbi:hypothetical protein C1645_834698 [Glomus cerebriforme]|uniref:Uncharacterized protein n=1 Tax=Glomus cerebriforme TaxID=658196 RepID=A0A397SA58_9GLOM|nr:hypothetical protein C1645_834698 [Glomus cerebriforme]
MVYVGHSPLKGIDKIDPLLNGWNDKFKPYCYNSWNTLNYSLDKFRNSATKLKLSNIYNIILMTILYIMVNIAFITAVPAPFIMGTEIFNETIAADFFKKIFLKSQQVFRVDQELLYQQ